MDNKEIGAILKRARENTGLERETIADMIGKSVKTVGHWETGYSAVDANTLFALCRIYGIDMNEAFGFSGKDSAPKSAVAPQDTMTADMERLLQSLTAEQARLLCSVATRWMETVKAKADGK